MTEEISQDQAVLTKWTIGTRPVVPIDRALYARAGTAVALLRNILEVEENFDVLIENYADIEACRMGRTIRNLCFSSREESELVVARVTLARHVSNFLSSARLYVDSLPRLLEEMGIDPSALLTFKSAIYDANLEFRACESLRNYVQHRGLPVHSITFRGSREQTEDGLRLAYSIIPEIMPTELALDKKFKASVAKELTETGSRLDLMPILRKYIKLLGEVHWKFREIVQEVEKDAKSSLDEAVSIFLIACPDEQSLIGLVAAILHPSGSASGEVYVAQGPDEFVRFFRDKNRGTVNFAKRYARW